MNIDHLTGLHLKPPSYWSLQAVFQESISFPNLCSLTLEQVYFFTNMVLLTAHKLEKLTLLHCMLFWDTHSCRMWQTDQTHLKCLELICVLDASEKNLNSIWGIVKEVQDRVANELANWSDSVQGEIEGLCSDIENTSSEHFASVSSLPILTSGVSALT